MKQFRSQASEPLTRLVLHAYYIHVNAEGEPTEHPKTPSNPLTTAGNYVKPRQGTPNQHHTNRFVPVSAPAHAGTAGVVWGLWLELVRLFGVCLFFKGCA